MLNKIIIQGRLTRDPETKTLNSGSTVCEFNIANNRKYNGNDKVTFLQCNAWGKTGEVIQKYFRKGGQIIVEGILEFDKWNDAQGNPRDKHSLNVKEFHFDGPTSQDQQPSSQATPQANTQPPVDDGTNYDDIPF